MVLIQNQCFGMSGKVFVVTPAKASLCTSAPSPQKKSDVHRLAKARALLFLVARLGLGCLDHCVSGSDFCSAKSRARILQTNSSLGLGFLN